MEPLADTQWDVLISGTDLAQSLLALALSRSGKNILHVDRDHYYGGAEAALSLQDAEDWLNSNIGQGHALFRNVHLNRENSEALRNEAGSRLGFSRAYSLALGPQVIFSRSKILPALVSSKVYRQLEFLAIGSYWIYESVRDGDEACSTYKGTLSKIPSSREDIFADKSIDLRSKRSLVRFLKLVTDPEAQAEILQDSGSQSFRDYLTSQHGLSTRLQMALHALTLSLSSIRHTSVSDALPRISTHLKSIGVFGPGFGAVIPKWGGVAEIAQVACRACAVGGGIYMLGNGITSTSSTITIDGVAKINAALRNGDSVQSRWLAGNTPDSPSRSTEHDDCDRFVTRSISIVSSALAKLFVSSTQGVAKPAGSIAVFPPGSLGRPDSDLPTYLMIHSSDTGECPAGQCVIYASTLIAGEEGFTCLRQAVQSLLEAMAEAATPEVLWTLGYQQRVPASKGKGEPAGGPDDAPNVLEFPEPGVELSFDDSILEHVKEAWQKITGEVDGFMEFEDREAGAYDDYGD